MAFGSGISFAGLGSGIDSVTLIQRLVQLESLRKAQYESKKTIAQDKLTAFGDLKEHLDDLKVAAKELSESGRFLQLAGSASREGALTFTVSSSATVGSHSIEVLQLAANDRWAFDSVADPDVDLATGAGQQVTFQVGANSYAVDIDPTTSTLNEIAAAITTVAGADVEASVVNVGTEAAPSWKLVLASKSSGESGRIHGLASTVGGLTIDGTEAAPGSGTPVSANQIVVGLDARAIVDGLLVTRDSNEFEGVIQGVSFTATSADPGEPVILSVQPDTEAIKESLKAFVEAYNKLVSFANTQNTYTEEDGAGGELFGDSALSIVRSSIRSALFDVDVADVMADTEGYSTLGLVGLDVQKNGTITINETKLDEKIAANLGLLADLFTDDDGFDDGNTLPGDPGYGVDVTPDSGLAATLVRAIDALIDRGVGPGGSSLQSIFAAKEESIKSQISLLDDRIADEEYRLERFEENLRIRFANLENLMGSLNSQSAALAAMTGS